MFELFGINVVANHIFFLLLGYHGIHVKLHFSPYLGLLATVSDAGMHNII